MSPSTRRALVLLATVAVIAGAVGIYVVNQKGGNPAVADEKNPREQSASDMARMWPLFGGHVNRNMVNSVDKNVPDDWAVGKNEEKKNLKWAAKLGSRSYGGPVIAGGKIFVGTNNEA